MRRAGLLWATLAVGCGPMYGYGRIAGAPGKPAGCPIGVVQGVPSRPYQELGVLAPPDIEDGSLAGGENRYLEEVRDLACAAGGDAIVVERDPYGRYVRGTVIKYK